MIRNKNKAWFVSTEDRFRTCQHVFMIHRSLAEFWHWFVANVPGNSVGEGEEIFQLLHPLVLPEGNGGHRYGYFVMKQPGLMDYSEEGGPSDNCSPTMSVGRGPYRYKIPIFLYYNWFFGGIVLGQLVNYL